MAVISMMKLSLLFGLPLLTCACSGSWTAADATNARDSARIQLQLETICGREDAGPTCAPAAVRALERASYCASESMLFRHGIALDGGIACRPTR